MTYKEWCIGRNLGRFPKESWYRHHGRRGYNKIIRANYFSKRNRGIPIDVQVQDINEEFGYEFVTIDDVIDFVMKYLRNPFVRKKKPKYTEMI